MNDLYSNLNKYIDEVYYDCNNVLFKPRMCMSESFPDFRQIVKKSFSETLFKMIDEKNLKDTDVYKKANIDRRLFSKIRNKNYHPRKNTIIKFIFALELDLNEADELLMTSGYSLSTSDLRDVIIMYFLEIENYDLFIINEVLEKYNQEYI